ncbi:MAG: KEOPS complex subunit Pcc1 [Candidatus Hodarchaeota archaeon]
MKEITARINIPLQFAPCDVVIQSLEPDNLLPSGPLRIDLSGDEKRLHIEISGCKGIETFIATVEDILQAIQIVESTAQAKNQQNQNDSKPL